MISFVNPKPPLYSLSIYVYCKCDIDILGNYYTFCISADTLEIKDTYLSIENFFKISTYIVRMLIKLLSLKTQASKYLLVSMSLDIYKHVDHLRVNQ
jgi:hypothetical protein